MEKFISCCGLDCATCDAREATLANDDEMRKATAEAWKKQFNVSDLPYESINCLGCRQDGIKFAHCYQCEIRKCAFEKGFSTCGECPVVENCKIIAMVHRHVPEALQNLKSLKGLN